MSFLVRHATLLQSTSYGIFKIGRLYLHHNKNTNIYIMKKSILLVCSIIVGLMGYSCSSDDNAVIVEEENILIGEWQLATVDFSHIEEVGAPYFSDFCIMEYISGYELKENGTAIVVVVDDKFGTNSGLNGQGEPIWNWTGGEDDFAINQPNPGDTNGLGFTPKDIRNRKFEEIDGQLTLTFQASLSLGSTAEFTLIKKEIDDTQRPELLDKGEFKETCSLLDR